MNNGAAIAAIIGTAACLVLAARNLRSHDLRFERIALMGVIWAAIIAGLAFVLQRLDP